MCLLKELLRELLKPGNRVFRWVTVWFALLANAGAGAHLEHVFCVGDCAEGFEAGVVEVLGELFEADGGVAAVLGGEGGGEGGAQDGGLSADLFGEVEELLALEMCEPSIPGGCEGSKGTYPIKQLSNSFF